MYKCTAALFKRMVRALKKQKGSRGRHATNGFASGDVASYPYLDALVVAPAAGTLPPPPPPLELPPKRPPPENIPGVGPAGAGGITQGLAQQIPGEMPGIILSEQQAGGIGGAGR